MNGQRDPRFRSVRNGHGAPEISSFKPSRKSCVVERSIKSLSVIATLRATLIKFFSILVKNTNFFELRVALQTFLRKQPEMLAVAIKKIWPHAQRSHSYVVFFFLSWSLI